MTSLAQIKRHAFLTRQLISRDLSQRHKGTWGGISWLVFQPLMMLAIYTVVFGLIFRPRWEGMESVWDYALVLFLGKIPYIFMLETVGRAPALISGHQNYVKKLTFPVGLLPVMVHAGSFIMVAISLAIWGVFCMILRNYVPFSLAVMPLVYLPMFLELLGISYAIAALGAYFRDVGQVVQPVLFSMMFLSPVFYPMSGAPEWLLPIFIVNPLTYPIEASRALLLGLGEFTVSSWVFHLLLGVFVLSAGRWFFNRVRGGFADVL